tara:strand:+ start:1145 stop:1426 length:282 start_codon:yes stop_codon:yes gene_type:complete
MITALLLMSCDDTPIKVTDGEKETTVELMKIAQADTTCHKVFIDGDDRIVIFDPETNIITHKLLNKTGGSNTGLLLFVIMVGLLVIAIAIATD